MLANHFHTSQSACMKSTFHLCGIYLFTLGKLSLYSMSPEAVTELCGGQ